MTVVLLSGGVDSAVALALASHGTDAHYRWALHVQHGQENGDAELRAAWEVAKRYAVNLEVVRLPLWGHSLSGPCLVPGRNAALLAVAAAYAEFRWSDRVVIGCNADDSRDYPDCREDFLRAMDKALAVRVEAPLLRYSKRQVIALAKRMGVPLEVTWTCYTPADGRPCGQCNACVLREGSGG